MKSYSTDFHFFFQFFKVVGYLTFENQTVEAWQHIFIITSVIMIATGIIYIIFYDGSLQPWNNPATYNVKDMKIRKKLLEFNEKFKVPQESSNDLN